MSEEQLPLPEKILMSLHNLCATYKDTAKKADELAELLRADISEVNSILNTYESEDYVKSFIDSEGNKRYHLTGRGILKISSSFT